MCAILGWKGKISPQILRDLYRSATPYGPHSAGLAYVKHGQTFVLKKAQHPFLFVRNSHKKIDNAALTSQTGFGHVRWATHGQVVDRNAHPFAWNDIVYGHNGVISNYEKFGPHEVDSQCLGPLINAKKISLAEGSCGVVWIQNGELYAYRRQQGLKCFTFLKNGKPTTLVVSRDKMLNIPDFQGVQFSETPLIEGVAYKINAHGAEEVWKDERPQREHTSGSNEWLSSLVTKRGAWNNCDNSEDAADAEEHSEERQKYGLD
jgi:glutamine phosphoribosylpyrophosphate amidotransferase